MSINEENERQRKHELLLENIRARRGAATEYARQSVEYGQQTLRALFLMNGGGILATLTLVGAFAGKEGQLGPARFVYPLGAFVVGLAFCALSMFGSHLNLQVHSLPGSNIAALYDSIVALNEEYLRTADENLRWKVIWTFCLAVGGGALSGIAFLVACWTIGEVFLSVE